MNVKFLSAAQISSMSQQYIEARDERNRLDDLPIGQRNADRYDDAKEKASKIFYTLMGEAEFTLRLTNDPGEVASIVEALEKAGLAGEYTVMSTPKSATTLRGLAERRKKLLLASLS